MPTTAPRSAPRALALATLAITAAIPTPASAQQAAATADPWADTGWILSIGSGALVQQNTGSHLAPLWGLDTTLAWYPHPNVGARLAYQFRTTTDWVARSGTTQRLHVGVAQLTARAILHPHVGVFAAAGPAVAILDVVHVAEETRVQRAQLDPAGLLSIGLDAGLGWLGIRLSFDALLHRSSSGFGGGIALLAVWR